MSNSFAVLHPQVLPLHRVAVTRLLGAVFFGRQLHVCTPLYPAGGRAGVCSTCGVLSLREVQS